MNIMLGFGSTEEHVRAEVQAAVWDADNVHETLKPWNDKADIYDEMPREIAPERYTRIHYYEEALHFMHINRRHRFSPDGWAMWQVDVPFRPKHSEVAP